MNPAGRFLMPTPRSKLLAMAVIRWGRIVRSMTLGVRVAAFDEAGKVALVRHGYAPGWHLPGGGVDRGETAQQAAVRELREEMGVIATAEPRLIGLFFNPGHGGRDHVALFRIDAFERGPEPRYGREIAERGWFSLDALPEGTTPATRRRLAELSGDGAPPPAHW
jgi:ADP-ribose pyrophosphatase YjhB (NUDIX family)